MNCVFRWFCSYLLEVWGGWSMTDEETKRKIQRAKSINCNCCGCTCRPCSSEFTKIALHVLAPSSEWPDPAVTISFIKKESFNLQIVMNQWVNDPLKGQLGFKYQGLSTICSKNRRSFWKVKHFFKKSNLQSTETGSWFQSRGPASYSTFRPNSSLWGTTTVILGKMKTKLLKNKRPLLSGPSPSAQRGLLCLSAALCQDWFGTNH